MNQEEKIAKIQEVLADKDFIAKVMEMENPEEVQKAFQAKGIELTLEEIEDAKKEIGNRLENADSEEISDEQLEQVAGGVIGTAVTIATAVVGAAGALAALGNAVNRWTNRRW